VVKIALHHPLSKIEKTICLFSRGKYCHASIILDDGSVYESKAWIGVRKKSSISDGEQVGKRIDLYTVKLKPDQKKLLIKFLESRMGWKYDYFGVLGFVIYSTRETRLDLHRVFCSELVAAALGHAKFKLLERIPAWKVAPVMLSWSPKIKFEKTIVIK